MAEKSLMVYQVGIAVAAAGMAIIGVKKRGDFVSDVRYLSNDLNASIFIWDL